MPQQRLTEVKVGIFVVVCLLLAGGMIMKYGKRETFG